MDPSNEKLPYEAAANISDLVDTKEVAERHQLGPNGSLLYAMEYLEKNFAWLEARLQEYRGKYILFDFPGQVELYTHNKCVRNIVQRLQKNGYRVGLIAMLSTYRVMYMSTNSRLRYTALDHCGQSCGRTLYRRPFEIYIGDAHVANADATARAACNQRAI